MALGPWQLSLLLLPLLLAPAAPGEALEGTVVRVVDGDTIHVKLWERVEKVRYIGVNTPEVHHPTKGEEPGGREAMEANRRLVAGRRVRLETDVQARDRYGRLLAPFGGSAVDDHVAVAPGQGALPRLPALVATPAVQEHLDVFLRRELA